MNFDDFIGVGALSERLRADVNTKKFPHAYLFVGSRGTGKRSMAGVCARALNCLGAVKPCDQCPPCRRALSGTHPDLVVLSSRHSIGVDDVRGLIGRVMMRPYEGDYHAVIVEDAQALTPQAQNALLKTLESPPESAVFFLIADSAAKLLPTVLSRCRLMRFPALSRAAFSEVLLRRGVDAARIDRLFDVTGGSAGEALAFNADAEYWALRDQVEKALQAVKTRADVGVAAALLKDSKEGAESVLSILESIGLRLMRRQESAPDQIEADDLFWFSGDRLLAGTLHARERLRSNVTWQNILERFFSDLTA